MTNQQNKITIDAAGKRPGRLATEIADILNGKRLPDYAPNALPDVSVEVSNAAQMYMPEKKKTGTIYERYTGYFGGRKRMTAAQVAEKKGYRELLRRAVYGMLPGNRLRNEKMKKLHINE